MDSDGQALLDHPVRPSWRLWWHSILMLALMAGYFTFHSFGEAVEGVDLEFESEFEDLEHMEQSMTYKVEAELADFWLPEQLEELSKLLPALRAPPNRSDLRAVNLSAPQNPLASDVGIGHVADSSLISPSLLAVAQGSTYGREGSEEEGFGHPALSKTSGAIDSSGAWHCHHNS